MVELSSHAQTQLKLYSLQSLVTAMLVRHLEVNPSAETEGEEILNIALGSIATYDLRGPLDEKTIDAGRATMEAFATETLTAALHSVRLRNQ